LLPSDITSTRTVGSFIEVAPEGSGPQWTMTSGSIAESTAFFPRGLRMRPAVRG
jgi:hypothetical protein